MDLSSRKIVVYLAEFRLFLWMLGFDRQYLTAGFNKLKLWRVFMKGTKQYKKPLFQTLSFECVDVLSTSLGNGDYGTSWKWDLLGESNEGLGE